MKGRRATWAWWGAVAAVLGAVGHLFTDPHDGLSPTATRAGADYILELDRTPMHVGVVAGFLAVGCLLAAAAGWGRWARLHAPESAAAPVVPISFAASAGAMILGYGFKGSLAVYLPGGIDAGDYSPEGLQALFVFIDLGPYMAWTGVLVATAAVAWLSLRERRLPLWIGAWSAVALLPPLAWLVLTGLPGFPGVTGPLWLLVTSVGVALSRGVEPAG